MPCPNPFADILALPTRQAVILDGGFGTELERRGKSYAQDPLWSASVLANDPALVQEVHRAYYDAGADVGTTCSYQATHAGFQKAGFGPAEAEELFRRSVRLTAAARNEFWEAQQAQAAARQDESQDSSQPAWQRRRVRPLVAFSSGPYAAALADGSEYTGAYADSMTLEQLLDFHRRKLQAVAEESFDVVAFETIPALKEARAIAQLLRTELPGTPAWLTFNCRDGRTLARGESFAREAMPLAFEADNIIGIGVNCVHPSTVPSLLQAAQQALRGREAAAPLLVAYPNSGEGWSNSTGRWDGRPELQGCDLGAVGRSWVAAGARIVGGCCRTTPEYISSLAAALT